MREHINSAFFLLALENGLSAAIINPGLPAMTAAYKSFLVLHGMDENCSGYVEKYGQEEAARKAEQEAPEGSGGRNPENGSQGTGENERSGGPHGPAAPEGDPAETPLKRSHKEGDDPGG